MAPSTGCAAVDELEDAEQRSAARIELEQQVRQLEESIVLAGAGGLDELVAAAETADADELAALVLGAADKVAELEARHTELVAEVARRELELDQNVGGAEAAAAAERAENARATSERLIESFVESKLAAVLLRRAIERYRSPSESSPVLRSSPHRETFAPVGAAGQDGYGPAWWLDERDAARAAANDPEVQAVQREIDRQTRLAANHGLDPLIPEQARQIAELRRAERRLVDRHGPATWPSPDEELVSFGAAAYPRADSNVRAAAGARRFRSKEE